MRATSWTKDKTRARARDAKRGERMSLIDRFVTNGARRVARATGRRHFLARFGASLVGASALPLLPVARAASAAATPAATPSGATSDSPRAPQPQEQGDP